MITPGARIPRSSISPLPIEASSQTPSALGYIWNPINLFLEWFGDLGIFAWRVAQSAVRRPFEGREWIRRLDQMGSKSLPLVALASAVIVAVLSLESRSSLVRFEPNPCFRQRSFTRSFTKQVRS
jgi:ABC-type transporter Mla maintaining outer membrane lipid asymmetry permease subunit MlaE